jgi:hypothetical protein
VGIRLISRVKETGGVEFAGDKFDEVNANAIGSVCEYI